MYWAIVTLTTVGFGDITPLTPFGKFLASVIMLLGYAIIAVPTGIVTSELTAAKYKNVSPIRKTCPTCDLKDHDRDAAYCKFCGSKLERIL
jgi:voltage-gated potassium channel